MRSLIGSLMALVASLLALAAPAHAQPLAGHDHRDTITEVEVDLAAAVESAEARSPSALPLDPVAHLPTTWCGTARSTDDAVNAAQPSQQARFKLVYAHAADQPDRFAKWADALQANASIIGRFMAPSAKAPRWDMGTSCGPAYVDIQTVALPSGRDAYVANFDRLANDVNARLGATSAKRNVVIFADGLTNGSTFGLGEAYNGDGSDSAGAGNVHNDGGLMSAIFVAPGKNPPFSSADGIWPEGFLHEMSHNMGAVQFSAPHTSAAADGTARGHCWDGSDVMCYDDGPAPAHAYDPTVCARTSDGPLGQLYDCNSDDYFNPAPAPGSYLATHWNLWDSAFYGACGTLGLACGVATDAAPGNVSLPRISGEPSQGSTLTADTGTWTGSPTTFTTAWQRREAGGAFADIPGAGGSFHVLQTADAGRELRVVVTAGNAAGATAARSAAVTAFALPQPEPPPPVASPPVTGSEPGAPAAAPPPLAPPHVDPASAPSAPVQQAPANPLPDVVPASATSAPSARRTLALRRGSRTVVRLALQVSAPAAGRRRVQILARRVSLRSGRYRLRLCSTGVCRTRSFVARSGRATLPRLVVEGATGATVTAALRGPAPGPQAAGSLRGG